MKHRRVGMGVGCALVVAAAAFCMGGTAHGSGAKALFYDEGDVSLRSEVPATIVVPLLVTASTSIREA